MTAMPKGENEPVEGFELVTISKEEYEQLKRDSYKLACLEAGGVDNWEWYGESLQVYWEKYHE